MSKAKRGAFIVIDGVDGSGKSTQISLLKRKLGKRALFTKEPGGTRLGKEIRDVLLARERIGATPLTDFFLFWAARAAHMEDAVAPSLARGRVVISDRFDSSTYAFQISAENHPELRPVFYACRKAVLGAFTPDVYIFLDISAGKAHARRMRSRKPANAFDRKPISYHERVRAGYRRFKPAGSKVIFVNADRGTAAVHKDIWNIVARYLA